MKLSGHKFKRIVGYIFILYALFGVGCTLYYQIGPPFSAKRSDMIFKDKKTTNPVFRPFFVRSTERTFYDAKEIKHSSGTTQNNSNIIILYGLSAIAGAILLTSTHNQPLNKS